MTRLLTFIILTILIGLHLFSCDPKETFQIHFYQRVFENNSDQDVLILYYHKTVNNLNAVDSLTLDAHSISYSPFSQSVSSEGVEEADTLTIIENELSLYFNINNDNSKLELYVKDSLTKLWEPPLGYFEDSINSPFNYNSWDFIEYNEVKKEGDNFIHGEIKFTISQSEF